MLDARAGDLRTSGIWGIVVGGGSGARFGTPKQFLMLGGRPVVEWSVAACRSSCDAVVLVLPADRRVIAASGAVTAHHGGSPPSASDEVPLEPPAYPTFGADLAVAGGATRSASVRCGLAAVPSSARVVVVHDAARPLASPDLFQAVIDAVEDGAAGAVCALPVTDTLKQLDRPSDALLRGEGPLPAVRATVDRSALVAVQTPQAFRAEVLRECHERGIEATDDAGLLEACGASVRVVPGDPRNIKLTTPADLWLAERLVAP